MNDDDGIEFFSSCCWSVAVASCRTTTTTTTTKKEIESPVVVFIFILVVWQARHISELLLLLLLWISWNVQRQVPLVKNVVQFLISIMSDNLSYLRCRCCCRRWGCKKQVSTARLLCSLRTPQLIFGSKNDTHWRVEVKEKEQTTTTTKKRQKVAIMKQTHDCLYTTTTTTTQLETCTSDERFGSHCPSSMSLFSCKLNELCQCLPTSHYDCRFCYS